MVYKFHVFLEEDDLFEREISIDSEALFIDFHHAILDSVNFDKSEMSSFFICDEDWEKEVEITLVEMDNNPEIDTWVMDRTHISELVEDEGQHLMFTYDYLTDRSFYIVLKKIVPGEHLDAPKCTKSKGKAPQQHIDFKEFEKKTDEAAKKAADKYGFDEDLYGDKDFDEEELSEGGFNDDLDFGGNSGFGGSDFSGGGGLMDDY